MWQPVSSTKKLSPPVTKRVLARSFFCRVIFDCQTVCIPIELIAVGPAKNISSSSAGVGGVEIAFEMLTTVNSERTGAINLEIVDDKKIRHMEDVELHIGRRSIRPALCITRSPKSNLCKNRLGRALFRVAAGLPFPCSLPSQIGGSQSHPLKTANTSFEVPIPSIPFPSIQFNSVPFVRCPFIYCELPFPSDLQTNVKKGPYSDPDIYNLRYIS